MTLSPPAAVTAAIIYCALAARPPEQTGFLPVATASTKSSTSRWFAVSPVSSAVIGSPSIGSQQRSVSPPRRRIWTNVRILII